MGKYEMKIMSKTTCFKCLAVVALALAVGLSQVPEVPGVAAATPAINYGIFRGAPYDLDNINAVAAYKAEAATIAAGGYVSDTDYLTLEATLISFDGGATYVTDRGGCIYIQTVITGLEVGDIVEVDNNSFYNDGSGYDSYWDQDPYWVQIGDYSHSTGDTINNWLIYIENNGGGEYTLVVGSGMYNLAENADDLSDIIGQSYQLTRAIKIYRGETLINPLTSSRGYTYSANETPGGWTPVVADSLTTPDLTYVGVESSYVDDNWAGSDNGDIVGAGYIFGQDAFDTIQGGINGTVSGGTVHVAVGTYAENVTVASEGLTITGEDRDATIIDGGGSGIVVMITANNVTFSGFTVTGSGNNPSSHAGIILSSVTGCMIENNIVSSNASAGIGLQLSDDNTVQNNLMNANYVAGIALMGSSNNTVTNNTSSNTVIYPTTDYGYGIVLDGVGGTFSTGNEISDNIITLNGQDGVYLGERCDSNTLSDNEITLNGNEGIYFWKSGTNTVTGNTVSDNGVNGLHLMGSQNNVITGNVISGSVNGFLIRSGNINYGAGWVVLVSSGNEIHNNIITGNTSYGIACEDNAGYTDDDDLVIDATENWWGLPNGPGYTVSNNVDYTPWLDAPDGVARNYNIHNETQDTTYETITQAVAAADDGDTLVVYDGIYSYVSEGSPAPSGLIKITKPITIKAAEGVRPIIDGSGFDGVFKIHPSALQPGGVVVIKGFEIKGDSTTDIAITMQGCFDITPAQVIIRDNWFHGMTGGIDFWGANSYLPSGWTSAVTGIEITINKFYELGEQGVTQGFGIMLEDLANWTTAGDTYAALVEGNEFFDIYDGVGDNYGVGIVIPRANDANEAANINITGNSFTGLSIGVAVLDGDVTDTAINNNIFESVTVYGVLVEGAGISNGPVDATDNWWGSASGPTHSSNTYNVDTQGDAVSDNVNYAPWLGAATEGEPFCPVYIGETGYASVQDAINDVAEGETIVLSAGTYVGNLTIETDVILSAPDGAKLEGTSDSPVITIGDHSVTIIGLEIDPGTDGIYIPTISDGAVVTIEDANIYNNGGYGINVGTMDGTLNIVNCFIHDNDDDGIHIDSVSGTLNIRGNNIGEFDDGTVNYGANGGRGISIVGSDGATITIGGSDVGETNTIIGHAGGIHIDNIIDSTVSIRGNIINNNAQSYKTAIAVEQVDATSSLSVTYNDILNNGDYGIELGGAMYGDVSINYNYISGHTEYGLYYDYNDGIDFIDATCNWWGQITGPYHSDTNVTGQGNAVSDHVNYSSFAGPVVNGVSPGSGSTAGGTNIIISGQCFLEGATATIGGGSVTSSTVFSTNSMSATTPAGIAGARAVIVTSRYGQTAYVDAAVAGTFTYVAPTVQNYYTLSVSSTTGGAVTIPGEGTFTYQDGAVVNLTAVPASGYHFTGWTGDVASTGAATTTVTMNGSKSVTANFIETPQIYTLTVTSGTGGLVMTPGEGQFEYSAGTAVTLTAAMAAGYEFAGWTGDVIDAQSVTTTVIMDSDKSITANFITAVVNRTLTVSSGTGGAVTIPGEGSFAYQDGAVVNLTAVPASGYQFTSWSGDVANTGVATTTITMSGNKSVTAAFTAVTTTTQPPPDDGEGIDPLTIVIIVAAGLLVIVGGFLLFRRRV
ncbi:hypothetical protein DGWBC_1011 [Dehalogenimonas sp. WBC-2]|nr:hypothetical protein DGWBC_1011 [Dehalogenimonas sp. WBC-2]